MKSFAGAMATGAEPPKVTLPAIHVIGTDLTINGLREPSLKLTLPCGANASNSMPGRPLNGKMLRASSGSALTVSGH